ncbi:MAG: response regulator [Hespellia sp.]|nr:response regulator [Hespellia sp.]
MKMLIVDDEEITRNGLLTSIYWESLGIHHVFLADDGINGLNIAKKERPDIILCDVRMPRMDGIEMATEISSFLPEVSIIFMSGYSDKEYLKAAIKLKAITYVEKPLDLSELKEAVLEARAQHQQQLRSKKGETLYSNEAASQLALLLTKPYKGQKDKISELIRELSLRIFPATGVVSYIVRLETAEPDMSFIEQIQNDLKAGLQPYRLQLFYTQLHSVYHVFHIIGENTLSSLILKEIAKQLTSLFSPLEKFYVCQGEPQNGISKVYQSYSSAVLLLQNSFYYRQGSLLVAENDDFNQLTVRKKVSSNPSGTFSEIILSKDQAKCIEFLDELKAYYYQNRELLSTQTKDDYYKLFSILSDCRQKFQLSFISYIRRPEENTMEYLINCFSYLEMHEALVQQVEQLFHDLSAQEPEDSTIFLIKDYISKNYANEDLSIKDISEHVFLSTSYVCTYFKNQTGSTLNQYLTEYRMERAELLLSDPRYPINDISSKVGYSNGNYFSKSFKKYTGLSPSKYREKILG